MEFLKGAKDFARNPLGIVALFISLIYGFASLLLGASADKLESMERWPLLLFVVFFPFAVLCVFYKLVTEHHGKLYSPGDYKDDDSFLKTLSPEEREIKLNEEAREATGDVFIAKTDNERSESISSTKERIKKAEQYVFNMFSKELNIEPEIGIGISSENYEFDAAYINPGKGITLLEVKYYSKPRITFKTVQEFVYRAKLAAEYMFPETKFILALVLDGDSEKFQLIADAWAKNLESSGLDIELRIINGEEIIA